MFFFFRSTTEPLPSSPEPNDGNLSLFVFYFVICWLIFHIYKNICKNSYIRIIFLLYNKKDRWIIIVSFAAHESVPDNADAESTKSGASDSSSDTDVPLRPTNELDKRVCYFRKLYRNNFDIFEEIEAKYMHTSQFIYWQVGREECQTYFDEPISVLFFYFLCCIYWIIIVYCHRL